LLRGKLTNRRTSKISIKETWFVIPRDVVKLSYLSLSSMDTSASRIICDKIMNYHGGIFFYLNFHFITQVSLHVFISYAFKKIYFTLAGWRIGGKNAALYASFCPFIPTNSAIMNPDTCIHMQRTAISRPTIIKKYSSASFRGKNTKIDVYVYVRLSHAKPR